MKTNYSQGLKIHSQAQYSAKKRFYSPLAMNLNYRYESKRHLRFLPTIELKMTIDSDGKNFILRKIWPDLLT